MYLEDERQTPCIDATLACYRSCFSVAKAGLETSRDRVGLLKECGDVCREAAHQLIAGSGEFSQTLSKCAEVCDRCAAACEQVDGMEECGAVCRWCADACRDLVN
jgi:hypothetical protein